MHRKADAALRGGRPREAIRALEAGLEAASDDFSGWIKLASLRRHDGEARAALEAVNSAINLQPADLVALLLKGSLHEQLGEDSAAAELYRAAGFHAGDGLTLPLPLRKQLDHTRGFLARHRAAIEGRLKGTGQDDPIHAARALRLRDNVFDRRAVFHQEPTHYRFPGLADVEYFDFAYAGLRERLQKAFPAIRDEFLALIARHGDRQQPYVAFAPGQPVGQWSALNRSPAWNALHLIRYGEVDPVNAAACPATIAALAGEHQPDVGGLTPNLMFSLLAPHTHIPAHHGVANFRAVLHLPLIVPAGCRFRVGADTREWREGQPWIFDDTIEHEAWNDSDSLRVVLIGDLWRPELDAGDRAIVRDFMAAQDNWHRVGAL